MPTKSDFSEWIKREIEDLRRMRDELRVQGHLAKAEVRDRWEALNRTLKALESRAKRTSRAVEQPLHELEKDARKLAQDLREGYRRLRDSI
jgi:predicted  nucleic acid-binding Zn-ribbon protein